MRIIDNRSWTKFQMEEHQLSTKELRWKLRTVVISDPGTRGKIEKTTPSKQFTLADVSLTSTWIVYWAVVYVELYNYGYMFVL